jgi:hypothetical protein
VSSDAGGEFRCTRDGEYNNSITGYLIPVEVIQPAVEPPMPAPLLRSVFPAPYAGKWLFIFSTEEMLSESVSRDFGVPLFASERIYEGDEFIRRWTAEGYRIALDPHFDAETSELHFIEVTRSPDRDPRVETQALGAALLDAKGDVVDIICIARATADDIRAAQEHAEQRGFKLVVQERITFCRDEKGLRAAVVLEGDVK